MLFDKHIQVIDLCSLRCHEEPSSNLQGHDVNQIKPDFSVLLAFYTFKNWYAHCNSMPFELAITRILHFFNDISKTAKLYFGVSKIWHIPIYIFDIWNTDIWDSRSNWNI